MRNATARLERQGDYWSNSDNEMLDKLFHDGTGITEIAVILQRSETAVMQQIEKLDLYRRKQYPSRQKNTASPAQCLCSNCKADSTVCPLTSDCPCSQEGI